MNLLVQTIVIGSLLLAGGILAWRNHRSGRGDRQGAIRMALAFFLLGVIAWICRAHHVADPVYEFILFQRGMGPVLYLVCLMWIFYMALEPYVRRVWPETVISWNRLLAGKWFDPLVGARCTGRCCGGRDDHTAVAGGILRAAHWARKVMPVPLPSITSVSQMLNATQNFAGLFNCGDGVALSGADYSVVSGVGTDAHAPAVGGASDLMLCFLRLPLLIIASTSGTCWGRRISFR